MLTTILIVAYILIALITVISLLINGIRPSKTLGWLLAIFTIPVGGVLLYLIFGRNRRRNKMFSHQAEIITSGNWETGYCAGDIPEDWQKFKRLILRTVKCTLSSDN